MNSSKHFQNILFNVLNERSGNGTTMELLKYNSENCAVQYGCSKVLMRGSRRVCAYM